MRGTCYAFEIGPSHGSTYLGPEHSMTYIVAESSLSAKQGTLLGRETVTSAGALAPKAHHLPQQQQERH